MGSMVDFRKIIMIEPGKRSGKPCICGMRITVGDVLGYMAEGMTPDEIIDDFPNSRMRTSKPASPSRRSGNARCP